MGTKISLIKTDTVAALLAERGIDISHETVRFWWNRFGPIFAAEIRKRQVMQMRGLPTVAVAFG
jgi:transposase-like protein